MSFDFTKAEGTGNDFIIIDQEALPVGIDLSKLVIEICSRKRSIGADGVMLYDKSEKHDFKMRIFNPDGAEVDMCGNGARCMALYAYTYKEAHHKMTMETMAGPIEIEMINSTPRLKLTGAGDIRLSYKIDIDGEELEVSSVNTGVPHVVVLVDKADEVDIKKLGKKIRYHKEYEPKGTNANFIEVIDDKTLKIRTYERGVEDETLACGTGSAASAVIAALLKKVSSPVNLQTASGNILKVYFDLENKECKNLYLEGNCNLIYKGKYIVT
jgi:diaminopimelate epimerase